MGHLGIWHPAKDPGQLLGELRLIEARQVDPLEPRQAPELGDDLEEWMAARKRVHARCHDHDPVPCLHRTSEVLHEIQRRRVGPVEVLDGHEDRSGRRRDRERVADGGEQPSLPALFADWSSVGAPARLGVQRDLRDETAQFAAR